MTPWVPKGGNNGVTFVKRQAKKKSKPEAYPRGEEEEG